MFYFHVHYIPHVHYSGFSGILELDVKRIGNLQKSHCKTVTCFINLWSFVTPFFKFEVKGRGFD